MSCLILFCILLLIVLMILLGGCLLLGSSECSVVIIYLLVVCIQFDLVWLCVDWQLILVKFIVVCVVDSLCINVCFLFFELEVYKGVSWVQLVIDMVDDVLVCGFEDFGWIGGVVCVIIGICVDYKLVLDVCCFEVDYCGQVILIVLLEINVKLIYVVDQWVVVDCIFCQECLVGSMVVVDVVQVIEQSLQVFIIEVVGWMLIIGQVDYQK